MRGLGALLILIVVGFYVGSGYIFWLTTQDAEAQTSTSSGHEWRGYFFVDEYGAVHDGVNNDRAAIQNAIDAAELVGGKVIFGPGTYVFDDSLVIDASISMEGVGRGNPPDWDAGTILYHIPTTNGKTSLRVGFDGDNTKEIDGITLRDFTIRADLSGANNKVGNCVHITGVTSMVMDNVDIFHKDASDTGKAALLIQATHENGSVTGFKWINGHIWYPGNDALRAGHGILLDSAVDSTKGGAGNPVAWFNTDCQFTNFKINTGSSDNDRLESRKAIIAKITGDTDSTNNNNHKFVNGYIDHTSTGGFQTLNGTSRIRFVNVNFDAEPDTVGINIDSASQGIAFIGCRLNTKISEFQTNPQLRTKFWDCDGSGSTLQAFSGGAALKVNPFAVGQSIDTTKISQTGVPGTFWIGDPTSSGNDSVFVFLNVHAASTTVLVPLGGETP